MKQAVPDQTSARWEGDRDIESALYCAIAQLPVAHFKMLSWSHAMGAREDVQTAVVERGLIQGNPHTQNGCVDCEINRHVWMRFSRPPGYFNRAIS